MDGITRPKRKGKYAKFISCIKKQQFCGDMQMATL